MIWIVKPAALPIQASRSMTKILAVTPSFLSLTLPTKRASPQGFKTTFSSNSLELPEAVDNFFNTAMKDGTMPVAKTFMLKDDSPLTIMAEYRSSGDYQMMELDISAQSGGETGSDPVSDSLIS